MRAIFLLRFLLLAVLMGLCLLGCTSRANGPAVHMSTPLHVDAPQAGSTFLLHTASRTGYNTDGLDLTLTAFLQSDAGMSIADNSKSADYTIDVTVIKVGITDEQTASLAARDVIPPVFMGTLGGVAVGGALGSNSGAAWGAGIGAILGLTLGLADGATTTEYVWVMVADVDITHKGKKQTSRLVTTTSSTHSSQEEAMPLLETELAQEIVRAFTGAR